MVHGKYSISTHLTKTKVMNRKDFLKYSTLGASGLVLPVKNIATLQVDDEPEYDRPGFKDSDL